MRVFLISHIADIDGLMPVILSELTFEDFNYALLENAEVEPFMREKIESNYFDDYDKVFMIDICVSKEIADIIDSSDLKYKFMILDHHHTFLELNSYDFITVADERLEIKESGTSLYYKYLLDNYPNANIKKNSVAYMVSLIRLYDTWEWKKYDITEAANLNVLLGYYGTDYFINNYVDFLKANKEFYFTKTENILIESDRRRLEEYIENKKSNIIFEQIHGYKTAIVFAELYRSELGNALAESYKDEVDFVIIINMGRSISYRGIKEDINLGEFASIYGGKGHKKAAGGPLPSGLKESIIKYIYGRDLDERNKN